MQKILTLLNPELAHNLTVNILSKTGASPLSFFYRQLVEFSPVEVMGLQFRNRVGLAAGFDKNGEAIDAFEAMGFGFVEVGTVTPKAQPGNTKPRLFRLKKSKAVINRLGFNNKGVDNLVSNLKARQSKIPVGVNIGKNKSTPIEHAQKDYIFCMEKVYEHASYITINISSPNTKNLRSMQSGALLDDLLGSLKEKQQSLTNSEGRYVPLVLKIAPDLTKEEVGLIAEALLSYEFDGVVATNTTVDRSSIMHEKNAYQEGGLSGAPLCQKSTEVITLLYEYLGDKVPIIGVGGITSVIDGKQKLEAGAQLLQLYTGFIYEGLPLIKDLAKIK
jgi:dihydroorotate dehydrogenase